MKPPVPARVPKPEPRPAAAAGPAPQAPLPPAWAKTAPPPLNPGQTFAGYVIERHLHRGAVGDAYAAKDAADGRGVILKILPKSFRDDEENLNEVGSRFQKDVHALLLLSCPQLPEIRRSDCVNGHVFLAYERIEGTALTVHRPWAAPLVLEFARTCAIGLGALNQVGLAHLDLRPENIRQVGEDRLVLVDFGILRPTMDDLEGRPAAPGEFASPEHLDGATPPDIRSDLHALGALMALLLTGATPFRARSPDKVRALILDPARPSLCAQDPELHPAVDRIVGRCLARDRDQRYQTPEALIRDLDLCPRTKPLKGGDRFLAVARELLRRHGGAIARTGLRLAILGVLVVAGLVGWNRYTRYDLAGKLAPLEDPACTVETADGLAPVLDRLRAAAGERDADYQRFRTALAAVHERAEASAAQAAQAKQAAAQQQAAQAKQAAAEAQAKQAASAEQEAAQRAAQQEELARQQAAQRRLRQDNRRMAEIRTLATTLIGEDDAILEKPTRRSLVALENALTRVAYLDDQRAKLAFERSQELQTDPAWEALEKHRRILELEQRTAQKKQEVWARSHAPTSKEALAEEAEDAAQRSRLSGQRLAEQQASAERLRLLELADPAPTP